MKNQLYIHLKHMVVFIDFQKLSLVSKNEFKGNPLTSLMAKKFKHLLNDYKPRFNYRNSSISYDSS